ncbi:MAG TPA: sigma-70 family RNA polymerase sigma factor [Candidatus Methylomirabilis sp.]
MAVKDVPRELLVRCMEGDRDAFAPIYEQFKGTMHTLAYHMMGNRADADEAAQEAFLAAWRGLGTFRFESGFGTWLYRMGVNVCLERLRREGRRRAMRNGHGADLARAAKAAAPAEADGPGADVRAALATLDPAYRACIILRDLEGLSYQEIAEALGAPVGTVRSRIARGRERLRAALRDWEGGGT